MSITTKMPLNWYSSMNKIEKDSDNFWHRKFTLKVRNWHFLIAWFRADVDLTKSFFYEKVLFSTQLSYHLMRKLLKNSWKLSRDYEVIHTTHQLIFEALAFKADLVHVSTYTLRSAHSFHVCFICII